MLNVLFVILKIIGITMLSIIGIILLLILLILFVPIRYKVNLEHGDVIVLKARIKWLFNLIFIPIEYKEDIFIFRLRLFGIKAFEMNSKEDKPKRKPKKKTKEKSKKKHTAKKKSKKSKAVQNKKRQASKPKLKQLKNQKGTASNTNKANNTDYTDKINDSDKTSDSVKGKKRTINNLINKIQDIVKSAILFIIRCVNARETLRDFVENIENKNSILAAFNHIKKILKHIGPIKYQYTIKFGSDDPSITGRVLAYVSIFNGMFGKNIIITPDFQNEVFEGNYYIKGRIRIFNILIMLIDAKRSKELEQLVKNLKQLKEDL